MLHRKDRHREDERRISSAPHRWQDYLPTALSSRYLADALGLSEVFACGNSNRLIVAVLRIAPPRSLSMLKFPEADRMRIEGEGVALNQPLTLAVYEMR